MKENYGILVFFLKQKKKIICNLFAKCLILVVELWMQFSFEILILEQIKVFLIALLGNL